MERGIAKLLNLENWRAYLHGDDAEHPRAFDEEEVGEFATHLAAVIQIAPNGR